MKVTIDVVYDNDFQALSEIWNEGFPDMCIPASDFEKQFREFGLDVKGCFVARTKSGVVGFAVATVHQIPFTSRSELPACLPVVVVRQKQRRKGIGTQLVKKAEEYFAALGAKKIRLGYPTYLRGTILSLIGLDIQWLGAVRFFETFGYAPRGALDSMTLSLENWQMPDEMTRKLEADREAGITFAALSSNEEEALMAFLKHEFPGSWHDQFAGLRQAQALRAEQVLIVKAQGQIAGFAGPFQIAPNGDTCGVGLGLATNLRGRGLGMSLVYSIIDFVKKSKGRQITLFGAVDKINYYGKPGFVPASLWLVMEKICRAAKV